MVSKISRIFRFIGNDDHQEVSRSPRKRRNPGLLDDIPEDCLETPAVKRVRFSPNAEIVNSHRETSHTGTPITRIASWVKMKANHFSTNYFFRAIANGTDHEHEEDGPDQNTQLPNSQHVGNAVQVTYDRDTRDRRRRMEDNVTVRPSQKEDTFTYPNLPSSMSYARRPLHSRRMPERSSHQSSKDVHHHHQSSKDVHHHHQLLGASPNLPVMRDRVDNWHRSHVLRSETPVVSRPMSSTLATHGSSVHERLFPAPVKVQPGACRNASVRYSSFRGKSMVEECVRLDDRQKYQDLLQQLRMKTMPKELTLMGNSLPWTRTALNRTSEVKVKKPPEQIDKRNESPIFVDLATSSPSVSRSQSPVKSQPPNSPKPSRVRVMKEKLVSQPYVEASWVEEMKERFESSVRISRRKAEEETAAYKNILAKKELERQKAIEKAKALFTLSTNSIHDVEKEFPLLELEIEPEVEEEEPLPELTSDMEDEIDRALRPNPSSQELVQGFRLQLTRGDIQTLNGLNWLNDEIINFFFSLLADRSDNSNTLPKVHTFNTFFYPKLIKSGYTSLRRWTKRVDVFAKDLLLVPIHLGVHWCLAIIDLEKKVITYYDSMGGRNDQCLNALKEYLVSEHQDKKKSKYDVSDWKLVHAKHIPLQLNGSDCGVFACKFAEYVTRDAPISFTQEDMPYFRRRMVWELLHKKLL